MSHLYLPSLPDYISQDLRFFCGVALRGGEKLCFDRTQVFLECATEVSSAAASNFNATRFSLVHQTCGQGADDEAEQRAKYYEPDRRICDGRPVRFEVHLCLHIFSSAEPELIKNTQDRERESA